ncbi:MAG TPA: SLBB domain-containing protein [Gemmatimonadaceae bacterium]|nr:SLBB domain-containing protein [Gemmatimonadaceae bacterium]
MRHVACSALAALVLGAPAADAQSTAQASGQVAAQASRAASPFATREVLTARSFTVDSAARATKDRKVWEDNVAELESIRDRLQNGDFNVGDRVALRVANVPSLTDTFTVRSGRVLELPDIGQIPLTGVLWSELTPYLTKQIGKYVVSPSIVAQPLIRVAVSGAVTKPGFYSVRPDMLLSDALMSAGGPTNQANVDETTVRRNGKEIVKAKRLREEVASGATIDQLDLRAGDEIYVAEQTKRDWSDWIRTGAYVGAIVLSVWGGTRVF